MALHFLTADASAEVGEIVELGGREAHHAATVRRLRVGEEVTVGDGQGAWLRGHATEVTPARVVVQIDARRDVPPASPRLVLAQALAKGDRDELAIQAATELGVDEIVPWQAARSVSRWDAAKAVKGRERWETIVREAAKQAHRAWVPTVTAPVSTAQLAAREALIVVLDPWTDDALSALDVAAAGVEEIVLVVGPEGGIAPEELDRFEAAGAKRARLGDTVLRTSTAGPAALSVLAVSLGRW